MIIEQLISKKFRKLRFLIGRLVFDHQIVSIPGNNRRGDVACFQNREKLRKLADECGLTLIGDQFCVFEMVKLSKNSPHFEIYA